MTKKSFTLKSLIDSYDLPTLLISNELKIVELNKAWDDYFGNTYKNLIGQPCCVSGVSCRHQELLKKLEPYNGIFTDILDGASEAFHVRGFPVLDSTGKIHITEIINSVVPIRQSKTNQLAGSSEIFSNFRQRLDQAARSIVPIMLYGETGSGKEMAANYIHSQRFVDQPNASFVVLERTVLGDGLFESELFGHEKGAFTGANGVKKGLFELANNGTLFLDEIGELPLHLQPKLLRAIEKSQYRRVGGTQTLHSNIKFISATHRNLQEMVNRGKFREDLYFRLSGFELKAPALRERRSDIVELTQSILYELNAHLETNYRISRSALNKLLHYSWPGNVRELRNRLHLAASISENELIDTQHIILQDSSKTEQDTNINNNLVAEDSLQALTSDLSNPIDQFEYEFIHKLMLKHSGNRKEIANEMNISTRTLYRKLNRLKLI